MKIVKTTSSIKFINSHNETERERKVRLAKIHCLPSVSPYKDRDFHSVLCSNRQGKIKDCSFCSRFFKILID